MGEQAQQLMTELREQVAKITNAEAARRQAWRNTISSLIALLDAGKTDDLRMMLHYLAIYYND